MSYNLPTGCTSADIDAANQCYEPCERCGGAEWDEQVNGLKLCADCAAVANQEEDETEEVEENEYSIRS